ncbi:MAG: DUF4296 domain-containing protein [Muribaculaceae bacterium]|nr:DUF4296 domain-containing protein [Muribaculaceae bacterium]
MMVAVLIAACSRVPKGVLPPDKMADVMTDIHKGDAVVEVNSRAYRSDSLKSVLRQSILAKHNIDQTTLDSSIVWYTHNIDLYVEVYDKILENLDKELADARVTSAISGKSPQARRQAIDGDSVDLWPGAAAARFTSGSASEFLNFYLTSDRGWESGDAYHLTTAAKGLVGESPRTIVVEYTDGTIDYISDNQRGDGIHTTHLYLNPDKRASRVYGSIRVSPSAGQTVFLDSISLVRTRRPENAIIPLRGQSSLKPIR